MIIDLQYFKKIYSNNIELNIIGTSHDDRDIYEVILGKSNNKKNVLIHAGIHGREYLTSLLIMKQIEYYLKNYENEEYCGIKYRDLFNSVTFHLIPMVNPDGITISLIGIKGIRSEKLKDFIYECYYNDLNARYTCDRFKNYLKKWKANAIGVDLNRNFDAGWNELNQSKKCSFANYKGKCCNSEPESKALVNLVNKYNFISTVSYHSSGNLIYWDYRDSLVKNECSELADLISSVTGYTKEKSDYYGRNGEGFTLFQKISGKLIITPNITKDGTSNYVKTSELLSDAIYLGNQVRLVNQLGYRLILNNWR